MLSLSCTEILAVPWSLPYTEFRKNNHIYGFSHWPNQPPLFMKTHGERVPLPRNPSLTACASYCLLMWPLGILHSLIYSLMVATITQHLRGDLKKNSLSDPLPPQTQPNLGFLEARASQELGLSVTQSLTHWFLSISIFTKTIRWPYPKNEDDLTQKIKLTSPPKNEGDL